MLHKYDINKENIYIGSYPKNRDGYIPTGFTDAKLPKPPKNGRVLVFNGKSWDEVVDNREKMMYYKNGGLGFQWGKIREPNNKELKVLTPISPIGDGAIWDDKINKWREKTNEEKLEEKIAGLKVVSFLGTKWEYTESHQWAVQLAENQASHWKREVLVFDAYNELHYLSRHNSNKLQTVLFDKLMEDRGITR